MSVTVLTEDSRAGGASAHSLPVPADNSEPHDMPPRRGVLGWIGLLLESVVGGLSLWIGLAVLASAPVLQFLTLGYLVDTSGRIVREGRLSAGFFGFRKAARVGVAVGIVWLMLLVVRLVGASAVEAELIAPRTGAAAPVRLLLVALCLWMVLHVAAAVWRGGRLRNFLWPRPIAFLREVSREGAIRGALAEGFRRLGELQLWRLFLLGLKAFAAGLLLLVVPTTLLAAGLRAPLLGLIGAMLLAVVVVHLPLLQARLAATGRVRDGLNFRAVWRGYVRAPLLHAAAVAATLLLALPLYLLKIELIPREAAWLPSLLFVASVWPARLLAGWAVARSERTHSRWWRTSLWWVTLLGLLTPLAVGYTLVLFFTRYASWYGVASLYEQHAFLLPAPFLGDW